MASAAEQAGQIDNLYQVMGILHQIGRFVVIAHGIGHKAGNLPAIHQVAAELAVGFGKLLLFFLQQLLVVVDALEQGQILLFVSG